MIIARHSRGKHKTLFIKSYLTEENTCRSNKKYYRGKHVSLISYFQSEPCHMLQKELESKSINMEREHE